MADIIQLDAHKLDRIDQTADIIADFGHESYYDLYERFKHLNDLNIFVTKLSPDEDARVRVGAQVALADDTDAIYTVLDLVKDHTSGEQGGISPGRLALLLLVQGFDGENAAGAGVLFLAAEPGGEEQRGLPG